jgi:membrane-bound hydrogenase subunit mbhJ
VTDVDTTPSSEAEQAPLTGRHHAVWCMTLNMGSCNGCDQQIVSLLAPRYALQRRGISFATSPRHADIILLTGTLTRQSADAVRRVLAQVPDPHALIAVGDCAIDGGPFAASELIVPNAAEELGVNIEIAGNPPTPSQILQAIEEAARLLDSAEAGEGAEEEEELSSEEEEGEEEGDAEEEETEEDNESETDEEEGAESDEESDDDEDSAGDEEARRDS